MWPTKGLGMAKIVNISTVRWTSGKFIRSFRV
jgi:hypothetical protein